MDASPTKIYSVLTITIYSVPPQQDASGGSFFGNRNYEVSRVTNLRAMGATIRTAGKATIHDVIQLLPQRDSVKSMPVARKVAIPDTMQDIRPDRIKPNRTGANWVGII